MSMQTPHKDDLLKRFFNSIPLQVPPGGYRQVPYVPNLHTGNGRDPVEELLTCIEFNDSAASYLFTGYRGTGKTTELLRLTDQLNSRGCVAFYVDMVDFVNETSPLGIEDLLVALLGALSEAYGKRFATHPLAQGYWERFRHFMATTEVEFPEAKIPGIDFKMALKTNPSFKEGLSKALQTSMDRFVLDCRAFVDSVVAKVQQIEGADAKVVLIVDSLEKLRGSGASSAVVFDSINNTFFGNASHLRFNSLHVVYSVPPTLPLIAPGVGALYGSLCSLPQIKVDQRPKPGTAKKEWYIPGLDSMVEVISKRFPDWNQVFAPSQLQDLAHASGGNLRIFFHLVRRVLLKAPRVYLPLAGDTLLQQAKDDVRADMQLSEEDRAWLRKVRDSQSAGLDKMENLHILGRLCDNLLILDYRNGELWYDVLPLMCDLLGQ